jgi:hypothetical protein
MLAKKVSGAPVLDAAGKKLVGVLSETDLCAPPLRISPPVRFILHAMLTSR